MKSKLIFSLSAIIFYGQTLLSQVPKKTIVEHFTNTKCSICASRNPGFYSNLNNQPGVLHLAIHPSSPYNGCQLYQQNSSENDARTNYYGVYGGTPRLVINGSVISANANYSDNSMFTPFLQQTSPALININQIKFGADSIRVRVVVKTVAAHSLGALSLFVALAEDTIIYTGSNGEPKHFDVFRKSLSNVNGTSVALPPTPGDSIVFTASSPSQLIWNFNRINTYVILQESNNKNLVQSEKYLSGPLTTGIRSNSQSMSEFKLFPNPSNGVFSFDNQSNGNCLEIRNSIGDLVLTKKISQGRNEIDFRHNANGIYVIRLLNENKVIAVSKLVLVSE